jgi:hypothetical protein
MNLFQPSTTRGTTSIAALPDTVDLSALTDNDLASSSYAQVIWGASSRDSTGVTKVRERHEHNGVVGNYEPVGLAVGDWDGDGRNDLAIGAGSAGGSQTAYTLGDGVVYVIFGGGAANKLRPGNSIDLANSVGSTSGPDFRIVGKNGSGLGSGLAFLDADAQGETGRDDLVMGAPYAALGGDSTDWDYKGEAYIIWGDTKSNLLSPSSGPGPDRDAGTSGDVNVTIIGQDGNDQEVVPGVVEG